MKWLVGLHDGRINLNIDKVCMLTFNVQQLLNEAEQVMINSADQRVIHTLRKPMKTHRGGQGPFSRKSFWVLFDPLVFKTRIGNLQRFMSLKTERELWHPKTPKEKRTLHLNWAKNAEIILASLHAQYSGHTAQHRKMTPSLSL